MHEASRLQGSVRCLYRKAAEEGGIEADGPRIARRSIAPVSSFGFALGEHVARDQNIGVDTHWGNPGFCIDVALRDAESSEDATLGVLCDFARYPRAPDPVEWDIFRTQILRDVSGWDLHRVWTPDFFRDPEKTVRGIASAALGATARHKNQNKS